MKRLLKGVAAGISLLVLVAAPVLAIADPDTITLHDVRVFQNIFAASDVLFVAEYDVAYAAEPSEDPDEAFLFSVYDTDGTTLLISRPLEVYQYNIIGIYLSAAQVTALGITWGEHYECRVMGNPALFTLVEGTNQDTFALSSSHWIEGTQSESRDLLTTHCRELAENLETDHSATYLVATGSGDVLNSAGRVIFITAIPGLDAALGDLFQMSQETVPIDRETPTDALETATTISGTLGSGIDNAMQGLGDFFGIGKQTAAAVFFMMAICLPISAVVFWVTNQAAAGILMAIPIIIFGSWMGFINVGIMVALCLILFTLTAFSYVMRSA